MQPDFLKKLFIFVGIIFFILMLGPYFGLHPLGAPTIPRAAMERMKRKNAPAPMMLPDDDAMVAVPHEQMHDMEELDIIDGYGDAEDSE